MALKRTPRFRASAFVSFLLFLDVRFACGLFFGRQFEFFCRSFNSESLFAFAESLFAFACMRCVFLPCQFL